MLLTFPNRTTCYVTKKLFYKSYRIVQSKFSTVSKLNRAQVFITKFVNKVTKAFRATILKINR